MQITNPPPDGPKPARGPGALTTDREQVRGALVRQWSLIVAALPTVQLHRPSRCEGWQNQEVLAHLCLQPILLRGFLATASARPPRITLGANLSGTRSLAALIDSSAREGAGAARVDFAKATADALPELWAADLSVTVVTMQGPILLADYLVTRCVEAVVHGMDIVEPVEPDPVARDITAEALIEVLALRAPHLVPGARELPPSVWIEVATGRRSAPNRLAGAVPVMT
ncbi:MAG: maleylpyruvate isomerase N-terminal domain-containing protein [Acidimicrobiales bacterium]|jgi:hypothetical protein